MPYGAREQGGEAAEDMLNAIDRLMCDPGSELRGAVIFTMEETKNGDIAGGVGVYPNDGRGFILVTEMLKFIESDAGMKYLDELHDRYHALLAKMEENDE